MSHRLDFPRPGLARIGWVVLSPHRALSVNAGVAAGHPATADAGAEILADGGSAADAAVAAALASCVAETVMTGLLGGGHAIYFDAGSGTARNLDFFCAMPGLGAPARDSELVHLEVPFGVEIVHYAVGPASCAVPGVPAGLHALWKSSGRLPWARLVEPALRLAREGVAMPPAHVACLEMLEPVMTLREGARIYAPDGNLLRTGDVLEQPGLVHALDSIAAEGAASAYTGAIAATLLELTDERGGLLTAEDLRAYEAAWTDPLETAWLGSAIPLSRWTLRRSEHARPPAATRTALSGRPRRRARRSARRRAPVPRPTRQISSRSTPTGTRACSRRASASARATGYRGSTCT